MVVFTKIHDDNDHRIVGLGNTFFITLIVLDILLFFINFTKPVVKETFRLKFECSQQFVTNESAISDYVASALKTFTFVPLIFKIGGSNASFLW